MPGEDDGWEKFEEGKTELDERTPVPEAVPETAITGSYKTLSGFEAAAAREISGARDMLLGRDQVFMAYKLRLMEKRMHPDAAERALQDFRKWFYANEELIQAALRMR